MLNSRSAPPVCLVIRWPQGVLPSSGPAALLRRLVEARLPATWAVESAEHAKLLAAAGGSLSETALLLSQQEASTAVDAIADGLHRFGVAGYEVTTLCADAELPRGQVERQLAQFGVRAIVSPSASGAAARPLPFGLWQVAPQATLPARRRWFRRSGGVPQGFFSGAAGPAVAAIDLGAIGSPDSRGWRELEQAIVEATAANDLGTVRVVTIADLTAELTRQTGAKPQRSILRAA